jgi:anti-anti-sigma factor
MSLNSTALLACERRTVAPDHQRVVATGEVDLSTGLLLTAALSAAQVDARHVVLDLEGATFIDMSGVRILLAAAEHAHATTGTFEIVHATAPVARMLALTGADRTLDERPALTFLTAKGAGDGARAASLSRARNRRSPLPSPSAAAVRSTG